MIEVMRRPIAARNTDWAVRVAGWLARHGVRPNVISLFSGVFAGGAGLCLAGTGWIDSSGGRIALFLGAILGVQLRLLCNLFDGMVAIEQGFKTPSGAIFNELPDRFADAFVLIGAGYAMPGAAWSPELGWLAALLAVITAYIRALGSSTGAQQHYVGPMAKQHRMALMTVACAVAIVMEYLSKPLAALTWGLEIVIVGCAVTIVRRCRLIVRDLEAS